MVPSLWLKVDTNVPYRLTTLERLPQSDEPAWFRTRGLHDRLRVNETTIFLTNEVTSSGVDDSHTGFKGRRNTPKRQFGSHLAQRRNHNQKPSQRGFNGGNKSMSRCIVLRSPVVNHYTQSNSITSEQGKSDNDVNSALTMSSSQ
jgi:hypothetical protein